MVLVSETVTPQNKNKKIGKSAVYRRLLVEHTASKLSLEGQHHNNV